MDIKMKQLLLIFIFLSAGHAEDYTKLLQYKQNFKKNQRVEKRVLKKKGHYANYVQIIYYDINDLDTYTLEKKYNLELYYVVADGVCIFIYKGKLPLQKIITRIKSLHKEIKDIRKYKSYQFKTF